MPSHHTLTSLSHKTSKPVKHTCDSQTGATNNPGLLQYVAHLIYSGNPRRESWPRFEIDDVKGFPMFMLCNMQESVTTRGLYSRRYSMCRKMTAYKCVRFDEVEELLRDWYLNDSENDAHKQTEVSPSKFYR